MSSSSPQIHRVSSVVVAAACGAGAAGAVGGGGSPVVKPFNFGGATAFKAGKIAVNCGEPAALVVTGTVLTTAAISGAKAGVEIVVCIAVARIGTGEATNNEGFSNDVVSIEGIGAGEGTASAARVDNALKSAARGVCAIKGPCNHNLHKTTKFEETSKPCRLASLLVENKPPIVHWA